MTRGPEGTRNAEEGGMALCLLLSSPAHCCPRVGVQLFELPEDAGGRAQCHGAHAVMDAAVAGRGLGGGNGGLAGSEAAILAPVPACWRARCRLPSVAGFTL